MRERPDIFWGANLFGSKICISIMSFRQIFISQNDTITTWVRECHICTLYTAINFTAPKWVDEAWVNGITVRVQNLQVHFQRYYMSLESFNISLSWLLMRLICSIVTLIDTRRLKGEASVTYDLIKWNTSPWCPKSQNDIVINGCDDYLLHGECSWWLLANMIGHSNRCVHTETA